MHRAHPSPRSWVLLRTDGPSAAVATTSTCARTASTRRVRVPRSCASWSSSAILHGLGTETIGTDAGQAFHFNPPHPAHYYMHGKGRYGLQCLANLTDCRPPAR